MCPHPLILKGSSTSYSHIRGVYISRKRLGRNEIGSGYSNILQKAFVLLVEGPSADKLER